MLTLFGHRQKKMTALVSPKLAVNVGFHAVVWISKKDSKAKHEVSTADLPVIPTSQRFSLHGLFLSHFRLWSRDDN